MIALIYMILLATVGVVYATRFHQPYLLYSLTREDGPVEWTTVIALVALSIMLLYRTPRLSGTQPAAVKPAGYALALLSLLAAGEEISWGQRLFGFQTSQTLERYNYQRETNLHNLIPGPLFNGLIIFTVAIVLVLIPLFWRKLKKPLPWWLPSKEISLLTLCTVFVNHYRVTSLPEKIGLAVLVLTLVWASVDSILERSPRHVAACLLGWITGATLYACRHALPAFNQQYEIRELLVILVVIRYCSEILDRYGKAPSASDEA